MSFKNNDSSKTSYQHSIETYCKYPGCDEVRAYKITGELHNFCKYHREKASENQRRYAQNKRERKRQKKLAQSSVMTNIYQEKYMNPMAIYPPIMPMGCPHHMTDPTSVDFSDGNYAPVYYADQSPTDEIVWLAEYLTPN